jgi:hypothetical protein
MLLFTADYKGMFFYSLITITRVIKEALQHQSNKQNLFVINKTKLSLLTLQPRLGEDQLWECQLMESLPVSVKVHNITELSD